MEANRRRSDNPFSCARLPALLSNFADTFVDFVVGGQFLPQQPSNPSNYEDSKTWADRITRIPPSDRLVAIGDIHGDLQKARQILIASHLMDNHDRWIGGNTVVVQVGDLLDRGDDELKVIYLFEKLKRQAEKAGGKLVILNGNHEIMNIEGDYRYVTPGAAEEFRRWTRWYTIGQKMKGFENFDIFEGMAPYLSEGYKARTAAFSPGGPISSRFFGDNPIAVVVGKTVFVHGGLTVDHTYHGLEKINEEVREWINGRKGPRAPMYLHGSDSIVWLRKYSHLRGCDCKALGMALKSIPAERMVVGHTIQTAGINAACDNRVLRIDVGMSKGCINGFPEALEIREDRELKVLTLNPTFNVKEGKRSGEKPGLGILLADEKRIPEIQVNA